MQGDGMPRYYFHSVDGSRAPDLEGTDLPDDATAQLMAVRYAGEVLKGEPGSLREKGQWRVEMTDDNGALLFSVITLAVDAPRPGQLRGEAAQLRTTNSPAGCPAPCAAPIV